MEAFIDLIKILIPAGVVLYAAYLMVRAQIDKEVELRRLEVRGRSLETILPARLQAYERMTLFLERMSPQNLLMRLSNPAFSARDFQKMLLDEIRNEYNHNASQQVYMSDEVWSQIKSAKEDIVMTINEAAGSLPPEATSLDLSRKIFEQMLEKKVDPIALAMGSLKNEIQQTF
ncbi:MAG: hypothetical protein MUC38_12645 [Cyclobacteriaceae bacterium]|jgi:hypothetical protein|nr:hypothetical protein [Cyclobacteriaceae bacterium]